MVQIAPSLLAADLGKLGQQIHELEQGGADWLHVDIMDGHFVPNITFGPLLVRAVDRISELPLDVHLMIENADLYLSEFRKAGADLLTVQYEACHHLWQSLEAIKKLGAKAGVAINPGTNGSVLETILEIVDLVLVMTVEPGFGGQDFIHQMLPKIRSLAEQKVHRELTFLLQVDGGIDTSTAQMVTEAGAEVLVSGTGIFKQKNLRQAVRTLRKAAEKGRGDCY